MPAVKISKTCRKIERWWVPIIKRSSVNRKWKTCHQSEIGKRQCCQSEIEKHVSRKWAQLIGLIFGLIWHIFSFSDWHVFRTDIRFWNSDWRRVSHFQTEVKRHRTQQWCIVGLMECFWNLDSDWWTAFDIMTGDDFHFQTDRPQTHTLWAWTCALWT